MGDIYGDMLQRDLRKLHLLHHPDGQEQEEKQEEQEEDDFAEIMHRSRLKLEERQVHHQID